MPDLDDVDKPYFDSIVPPGHMLTGFMTIVSLVRPDGASAWKTHVDVDLPMSSTIGFLELAKLDLIAKSGAVESLNTHVEEGRGDAEG